MARSVRARMALLASFLVVARLARVSLAMASPQNGAAGAQGPCIVTWVEMPTYARIDFGEVMELFTPLAYFADTPIGELFHADVQWVDVTGVDPQPEPC